MKTLVPCTIYRVNRQLKNNIKQYEQITEIFGETRRVKCTVFMFE